MTARSPRPARVGRLGTSDGREARRASNVATWPSGGSGRPTCRIERDGGVGPAAGPAPVRLDAPHHAVGPSGFRPLRGCRTLAVSTRTSSPLRRMASRPRRAVGHRKPVSSGARYSAAGRRRRASRTDMRCICRPALPRCGPAGPGRPTGSHRRARSPTPPSPSGPQWRGQRWSNPSRLPGRPAATTRSAGSARPAAPSRRSPGPRSRGGP